MSTIDDIHGIEGLKSILFNTVEYCGRGIYAGDSIRINDEIYFPVYCKVWANGTERYTEQYDTLIEQLHQSTDDTRMTLCREFTHRNYVEYRKDGDVWKYLKTHYGDTPSLSVA